MSLIQCKLLDTGFYQDQTRGVVTKALLAYTISCKHDDWDRRKYYAAVIQKLEGARVKEI
ncbi:MAG: hypothetical protein WBZ20_05535 [Nitrososphaeraceae archaeon]